MKLDFGVLWFEDQPEDANVEGLEHAITELGFIPHIEIEKDGSQIDSLAQKQDKYHVFDLVLIDLNLAEGNKGDELAVKVRELFSFTPILFYSAQENDDELKTRIAKLEIEGVFCSSKVLYDKRAIELIKNYAPSLERLTGMRGLAAQVVTEMDMEFREIIRRFSNEVGKEEVIGILDAKIENILDKSKSAVDSFENLDLDGRLRNGAIVGSRVLLETTLILTDAKIGEVKNEKEKEQLKDLRNSLEKYRVVLSIRNDLTHKGESEKAVAPSNFPKFRRRFVDCLKTIAEIQEKLFKDQ